MKKRVRILLFVIALVYAGCDKQRDLYDISSPLLLIEGNWVPSLGIADMNRRATAMLYKENAVTKEYFNRPNGVTARVSKGEYDILIFNGLMFSEENTNLDHIYFRNSSNIETFEAYVAEANPNVRLSRAPGEYLASNDMELLATSYHRVAIKGKKQYFLKYKDGRNGFPIVEHFIEEEITTTPWPVSYYAHVLVHLVNPSSAAIANGALRGFVGSVFMASGMPSHFDVTHQLRMNDLRITNRGTRGNSADAERGTIESPRFVTFGPPLDLPNRRYTFELEIVLKDGSIVNETFDVTGQIEPVIRKISAQRSAGVSVREDIPIELFVTLPEVIPGSSISVGGWGDDEIIRVIIPK